MPHRNFYQYEVQSPSSIIRCKVFQIPLRVGGIGNFAGGGGLLDGGNLRRSNFDPLNLFPPFLPGEGGFFQVEGNEQIFGWWGELRELTAPHPHSQENPEVCGHLLSYVVNFQIDQSE